MNNVTLARRELTSLNLMMQLSCGVRETGLLPFFDFNVDSNSADFSPRIALCFPTASYMVMPSRRPPQKSMRMGGGALKRHQKQNRKKLPKFTRNSPQKVI